MNGAEAGLWLVLAAGLWFALACLALAAVTARLLLRYPQENFALADQGRRERGEIPSGFEAWPCQVFDIPSLRGPLRLRLWPGDVTRQGKVSPGGVLFLHGSGTTWHSMIKYFSPYRELGLTLAVWELPQPVSFGYHEGALSALVFDHLAALVPGPWGVVGESLGGHLALALVALGKRPAFLVADCPFADFRQECLQLMAVRAGVLRWLLPLWLRRAALVLTEALVWRLGRFGLDQRAALPGAERAGQLGIPLRLVHGLEDRYVTPDHSRHLAQLYGRPEVLRLVPGARHAKSLRTDPASYHSDIRAFLAQVEFKEPT